MATSVLEYQQEGHLKNKRKVKGTNQKNVHIKEKDILLLRTEAKKRSKEDTTITEHIKLE